MSVSDRDRAGAFHLFFTVASPALPSETQSDLPESFTLCFAVTSTRYVEIPVRTITSVKSPSPSIADDD
jgi:hypothetical protein